MEKELKVLPSDSGNSMEEDEEFERLDKSFSIPDLGQYDDVTPLLNTKSGGSIQHALPFLTTQKISRTEETSKVTSLYPNLQKESESPADADLGPDVTFYATEGERSFFRKVGKETKKEVQIELRMITEKRDEERIVVIPEIRQEKEFLQGYQTPLSCEGQISSPEPKKMDNFESGFGKGQSSLSEPESVDKVFLPIKEDSLKFITIFKEKELSSLTSRYPNVKFSATEEGIEVTGQTRAVQGCIKEIKTLTEQVCSDKFRLDEGVNITSFTEASAEAEEKHKVIIHYKQSNLRKKLRNNQSKLTPSSGSNSVRQVPQIDIVFDRIENHPVDVIINTTNTQLRLRDGHGVSHSLLEKCGEEVQQQLNSRYPDGIPHDQLAVSGSGKNKTCKRIFHAALPYYTGRGALSLSKCYEYLLSVVYSALILATREGYHTIAFPAFGTGALQYPVKNVVQLMFKAFDSFNYDKKSSGSIKKIFIVISPESRQDVKQIFLAHGLSHWMKTSQLIIPERSLWSRLFDDDIVRTTVNLRKEVGQDGTLKCEVRFMIYGTLIQVINGDIKKACEYRDTVLVPWIGQEIERPTNTYPALTCVNPDVQNVSCSSYVSRIRSLKCVVDETTYPGKTLIHVNSLDEETTPLVDAITKGIEEAGRKGKRSLILPVPEDGLLANKREKYADVITRAVRRVSCPSVHVITLVIPSSSVFIDFASNLTRRGEAENPADTSMINFVDALWSQRFSGTAHRFKSRAAAFSDSVDAYMMVTSDSRQRNKDAAREVAEELRVTLC